MKNSVKNPLGQLSYVGDLLSTAYPTTVLYSNEKKEPIIVEWLDEDNNGDIHIAYKTSVEYLEQFIKGIISHIDFIKSSDKKKYYTFYNSISSAKLKSIRYSKIDKNALPKDTVYFDQRFSSDCREICEFFGILLPSSQDREKYFNVLKGHSQEAKTGLLRLHLNEGSGIGHGTVDTKVLGHILIGYEKLYHEVALDVIRGKDRDAKTNILSEDISIQDMSSTEAYIQEAASFSIYLKSKTDADSKSENYEFVSDEIFSRINDIITSSTSKKELDSIKLSYSSEVFNSLANFSETILENKVVLDIDYYNSKSQEQARQVIKPSEAHIIHNNIVSFSNEKEEKVEFTGQFTMLNTKTGYFVFMSKQGRELSGYFASLIKESMISYNFKDLYKVVITQQTVITLNNKEQITYTLESCSKVES